MFVPRYEDKLRDTQLPCYPKVKPTTISTTEKAAISNVEIAKNDSQNEEGISFILNTKTLCYKPKMVL